MDSAVIRLLISTLVLNISTAWICMCACVRVCVRECIVDVSAGVSLKRDPKGGGASN